MAVLVSGTDCEALEEFTRGAAVVSGLPVPRSAVVDRVVVLLPSLEPDDIPWRMKPANGSEEDSDTADADVLASVFSVAFGYTVLRQPTWNVRSN